jgi:cell division protease FtsH
MPQDERNQRFNFQDNKGGGDGQRKTPRFNIYWIYGLIALTLLGAQFMRFSPDLVRVSEQEFKQQMLVAGDVEKLDLVKNKDLVRIYVKPEALGKEFYVKKFGKVLPREKVKGMPLFEFNVTDWRSFKEDLRDFYKANNLAEVPENTVSEAEWFGPVLNTVVSLLVIVFAWILLMRKMGGPAGGGGPGGIFNIGKSKATLFEKGTKVNITFSDVAGLDEAKVEVIYFTRR